MLKLCYPVWRKRVSKLCPNAAYDALLDYIANSDLITVCQDTPTSYADATGLNDAGGDRVAGAALVPGNGNGDFVIASVVGGGRKLTIALHNAVPVVKGGTVTHVCLTLLADTTLRYITTCDSRAVLTGDTLDLPAWTITIGAAT